MKVAHSIAHSIIRNVAAFFCFVGLFFAGILFPAMFAILPLATMGFVTISMLGCSPHATMPSAYVQCRLNESPDSVFYVENKNVIVDRNLHVWLVKFANTSETPITDCVKVYKSHGNYYVVLLKDAKYIAQGVDGDGKIKDHGTQLVQVAEVVPEKDELALTRKLGFDISTEAVVQSLAKQKKRE